MRKTNIIKFVCKLDGYIDAIGLGNLKIVRGLKHRLNTFIMRMLTNGSPLLITSHGFRLYIYPTTADGRAYLLGDYEPYTTELFRQLIEPGMTVLDIGAQFGYFSLLAAKHGAGRVYAFEPVPANFELLRRTIQINDYMNVIHPVQRAVGAEPGLVTMFVYEGSDSHSMHRHPVASVREQISIECITLDEFLEGEAVDIIKIDIEGNEPYALSGLSQMISSRSRLALITELAPEFLRRAGVEPADYLAQLASFGFEVQLIDEKTRSLKPVSQSFLDGGDPGRYANLFCVKGNFSRKPLR
jgi:FkbM family methyltransferase